MFDTWKSIADVGTSRSAMTSTSTGAAAASGGAVQVCPGDLSGRPVTPPVASAAFAAAAVYTSRSLACQSTPASPTASASRKRRRQAFAAPRSMPTSPLNPPNLARTRSART